MKTISVESLSDASNYAVIKLPERSFPALLIQGDSLKILVDLAEDIKKMVQDAKNDDLKAAADGDVADVEVAFGPLRKSLLSSENVSLPYPTLQKAF